jgi:hypothetical protein
MISLEIPIATDERACVMLRDHTIEVAPVTSRPVATAALVRLLDAETPDRDNARTAAGCAGDIPTARGMSARQGRDGNRLGCDSTASPVRQDAPSIGIAAQGLCLGHAAA